MRRGTSRSTLITASSLQVILLSLLRSGDAELETWCRSIPSSLVLDYLRIAKQLEDGKLPHLENILQPVLAAPSLAEGLTSLSSTTRFDLAKTLIAS